jgi:DeoR/GlpR family transcriptional regulator of sugar metabolism
LNRFGADWAILSVDGISVMGEISTCHAEEAILDRIMIERAKQVLIVADETKIGRTGFSFVGRCDEKTKILTNKKS